MLEEKCRWLRREIINILSSSKRGHVGGALSSVEILVALFYGNILGPNDKFILSKGHISMALYPILNDLGYIDDETYKECYMNGNPLGGHPDTNIKGIEVDTGSLGHGLGVGIGMAMANKDITVYVLMGDGECNEGSVWEAAMFAATPAHKIKNIITIIDVNHICAIDFTYNASYPIYFCRKWDAFGWDAKGINGNKVTDIINTINNWKNKNDLFKLPFALIANTTKGKGISYMEDNPKWHHGVPNKEQLEIARREINGS